MLDLKAYDSSTARLLPYAGTRLRGVRFSRRVPPEFYSRPRLCCPALPDLMCLYFRQLRFRCRARRTITSIYVIGQVDVGCPYITVVIERRVVVLDDVHRRRSGRAGQQVPPVLPFDPGTKSVTRACSAATSDPLPQTRTCAFTAPALCGPASGSAPARISARAPPEH